MNRWMADPFSHMIPTDLNLLTSYECETLMENLSKRPKRKQRPQSLVETPILGGLTPAADGASFAFRAVPAELPHASPAVLAEGTNMDLSSDGMYSRLAAILQLLSLPRGIDVFFCRGPRSFSAWATR